MQELRTYCGINSFFATVPEGSKDVVTHSFGWDQTSRVIKKLSEPIADALGLDNEVVDRKEFKWEMLEQQDLRNIAFKVRKHSQPYQPLSLVR